MSSLRVTVRFLQPFSHGRGEDGLPEWPPSPLRLFQALVSSGVGREVDLTLRSQAVSALRTLERAPAPVIFAPATETCAPLRTYVPDNAADEVARRNHDSAKYLSEIAKYRSEKDVRPLHLVGEPVHYIFRNAEGLADHVATIRRLARSVTHLGWGIDMVAGDAHISSGNEEGEHWIPDRRGGTHLRVPVEGTLEALELRHAQFLRRLGEETFRPVSPLGAYSITSYARPTDPAPRAFVAFRLVEPITGDALWLEPTRRSRDVAAWLRHAVGEVCDAASFGPTAAMVHGHRSSDDSSDSLKRFSYFPLPTINPRLRRVEGIRRAMVVADQSLDEQLAWLAPRLGGEPLVWKGSTVAVLEPLPASDWVTRQYVGASDQWSTVTPVVLPGHDDGKASKAERLILKAFLQAGFDPEIVNAIEQLDWRKPGFLAGTDHASRYLIPDGIIGPVFHVRVRFSSPVVGPISIGSGRHRGLGIFARHVG